MLPILFSLYAACLPEQELAIDLPRWRAEMLRADPATWTEYLKSIGVDGFDGLPPCSAGERVNELAGIDVFAADLTAEKQNEFIVQMRFKSKCPKAGSCGAVSFARVQVLRPIDVHKFCKIGAELSTNDRSRSFAFVNLTTTKAKTIRITDQRTIACGTTRGLQEEVAYWNVESDKLTPIFAVTTRSISFSPSDPDGSESSAKVVSTGSYPKAIKVIVSDDENDRLERKFSFKNGRYEENAKPAVPKKKAPGDDAPEDGWAIPDEESGSSEN